MRFVASGPMLVVDASVLFEVVADTPESERLRGRLADDSDHAAPHLIDAEVLSVIQTHHRRGVLDLTAASQAVDDLRVWAGERWPHRPLLTLDQRLATNTVIECSVEIG
jgi:predicted nucleic acid-binding protein